MSVHKLYQQYYLDKDYTSIGLFRKFAQTFSVEKVFYPGSFVHITPSFVFSNVCYADSYAPANAFFKDASIYDYVKDNKEYSAEAKMTFYYQDYREPFVALDKDIDLLISMYAGFVGQATKEYLKVGGYLLCNNSHGDASMAALDDEYELVAVYNRRSDSNFSISCKNLDEYLIPKRQSMAKKELISTRMRGIAYTKSPTGYIFQKRERPVS